MARDTNAYVNTRDKQILLQKYGMLKYQVSQRATSMRTQTHFWPLLVKKAGATCISANYFAFFPSDLMFILRRSLLERKETQTAKIRLKTVNDQPPNKFCTSTKEMPLALCVKVHSYL